MPQALTSCWKGLWGGSLVPLHLSQEKLVQAGSGLCDGAVRGLLASAAGSGGSKL